MSVIMGSSASFLNRIAEVNVVVAIGSTDGVAATSAFLNVIDKPNMPTVFTQAYDVNNIDLKTWEKSRMVALLNFAVDSTSAEKTTKFMQSLKDAGHVVVVLVDEHGQSAWKEILTNVYGSVQDAGLVIAPSFSETTKSTCAALKDVFAKEDVTTSSHAQALLEAGNEADRLNFNTRLGSIIQQALASNPNDQTRRPIIAAYLASHTDLGSDEVAKKIQGWIGEYIIITTNHPLIIAAKKDLGKGVFFYDGNAVGNHNTTVLMTEEYKAGSRIVAIRTMAFVKDKGMVPAFSVGTNDKSIDFKAIFTATTIPALGGIAVKYNFPLESEAAVLEVLSKV